VVARLVVTRVHTSIQAQRPAPTALASALLHLPQNLFPGGAKAGWWAKTVQLDLEARGLL
jgi:hypothetical protein